jgi:DNA-binding FadR family transcriptional regulator
VWDGVVIEDVTGMSLMLSGSLARRPRSVSGAVGAFIGQLIDAEFAPGDRLPPERELATMLGVSRSSVREAMHELEQRRRIERVPGRGTTVLARPEVAAQLERDLDIDAAARADVVELRLVVEPQIAGLAAARASDADLLQLDQILALSHAGLTPHESLELDIRFHTQLAVAARNPLLLSLCELTNGWAREVRARSHSTRTGRRSSVEGHRLLYRAVQDHDVATAVEAMTTHLAEVARLIESTRA